MPEFVGRSLPRLEDRRFLTGQGRFVDDIRLPGELHAAFVRSPHAHAHIRSIDTSGAAVLSGVRGVFTGEDWLADGMGEGPILDPMDARDGTPMKLARRPILTSDAVRHVGDTVAMIVADDARLAVQAAEAVMVDYEERPAVVDARDALMPDAPLVHTGLGTNLSFDWEIGDEDAVAQALRSAAQVTTLELVNNRLCAAPLEPRAVLGSYAPGDDRYTLWTTTQMPHLVRRWLSRDALRVPEHRIRVVAPDVGGGFGQKGYLYAEEAAVLWASRRLGRPVRWTATRAEAFQVDVQARDHVTRAQLALDADGRIVALAVETDAGLGAYHVPFGCLSPTTYYGPNLCGVYKVPALHALVRVAYTHTTPVAAYRGVGRAEANYVIERLLDEAAREAGRDPVALRRRNLITPADLPYETAGGAVIDAGDPSNLLARLEAAVDLPALRADQREGREAGGPLMGIGLATTIDATGGGPFADADDGRLGSWDSAVIRVNPDGSVTVLCGTHAHGQSHQTTYAQVVADRLGCAIDMIEVVEGDTDRTAAGLGTFASRSMMIAGGALAASSAEIVAKATKLAAHLMGCAVDDVAFEDGLFVRARSNRTLDWADVADAAHGNADRPAGMAPGLEATSYYAPRDYAYPMAATLCVVEVDPQTGSVRLRDYVTADDHGVLINPMIVEGQIHGGAAQGIGQALLETVAFDRTSGQLLSGTFMDYALPRADDLPPVTVMFDNTPASGNTLGVKGVGESGTIAAAPAVVNAVIDALAHLGVRHIDMPLTPERVWRAIVGGGGEWAVRLGRYLIA